MGSLRASDSGVGSLSVSTGSVAAGEVSSALPLQQQIDSAYQSGLQKFVIPPGTYRIAADPKKGAHLFFAKMKNFEIEGTGVTLIFTTPNKTGFDFFHCEGVTLRGVTLLRGTLPFSQGSIAAVSPDKTSRDIQIDKGYPTQLIDLGAGKPSTLDLYDRTTREWRDEIRGSIEPLGPGLFRLHTGRLDKPGWGVGGALAWRGMVATEIYLNGCAGMKIVDVTIKGGAGFCVHESDGDGGNYYRYTVTYSDPPPGADQRPLMASNADAFHSDSVRHGPTLEDCHFEGMNDDGIPIHGAYALIEAGSGNQVTVDERHPAPTFCRPGDHLRLYDTQGALSGEAKVVAVKELVGYQPAIVPPKTLRLYQPENMKTPDYEQITLDQPVTAPPGGLIANADALGSGFVIRRCTVRHNRARGMLIKACDGLIEDCTIEGNSMGGIVIGPEMDAWNESDYARNVIVRHNHFIATNYWSQPGSMQAGALSVMGSIGHTFSPLPGGHRNILIEGNTFEGDQGPNVVISSVEGMTLRDNRFIQPMTQDNERGKAVLDSGALIWITQSTGVQVQGNTVSQPGPFLKHPLVATPSVTGTGLSDGVTVTP